MSRWRGSSKAHRKHRKRKHKGTMSGRVLTHDAGVYRFTTPEPSGTKGWFAGLRNPFRRKKDEAPEETHTEKERKPVPVYTDRKPSQLIRQQMRRNQQRGR